VPPDRLFFRRSAKVFLSIHFAGWHLLQTMPIAKDSLKAMVGVLRVLPFQPLQWIAPFDHVVSFLHDSFGQQPTATSLTGMAVKLHRQALLRYQLGKFTKVN
jgi:hypothetical protein